jgi:hypothetical protein
MFFDRTVGGDIGWPDSKTWLNAAEDYIEDKVESTPRRLRSPCCFPLAGL